MSLVSFFFFFNDTAPTEIYTLSLHDALPICIPAPVAVRPICRLSPRGAAPRRAKILQDRKSTRLNSSHANISYAVFCLKKKKKTTPHTIGPLRGRSRQHSKPTTDSWYTRQVR